MSKSHIRLLLDKNRDQDHNYTNTKNKSLAVLILIENTKKYKNHSNKYL